jgi:hypothetical protein
MLYHLIKRRCEDSMDYLLRDVDREVFKKARIKAIEKDLTVPRVLKRLIEMWVKGEIEIVKGQSKSKYQKGD